MKNTTTRVRVYIDRVALEPAQNEEGQASAHLISMIGGDSEIGALWAAATEAELFQIHVPGRTGLAASLGPEAQCFRGSLAVPGRKRPCRHLVAVSAELAKTKPGADQEGARTILCDDDPVFVFYRVARRYGLPVVPEWAPWFMRELSQRKAIRPLLGLGCSPVVVSGHKPTFLKLIGKALKESSIHLPEQNGAISWTLPESFIERSVLPAGEEPDEGSARGRDAGRAPHGKAPSDTP
jgi:hypothetical protein